MRSLADRWEDSNLRTLSPNATILSAGLQPDYEFITYIMSITGFSLQLWCSLRKYTNDRGSEKMCHTRQSTRDSLLGQSKGAYSD